MTKSDNNGTGHGAAKLGPGRLVLVVGPSGAGKDSVMRAAAVRLAGKSEFVFVQRVITRAPDAHEQHEPVTAGEFDARERRGVFALIWQAHGLSYAIPATIDRDLAAGRTVICNVSRAIIEATRRRYQNVLVIEITAAPDVLAARLLGRGREPAAARTARLERTVKASPASAPDVRIDNSGPLDDTVGLLLAALGAAAKC